MVQELLDVHADRWVLLDWVESLYGLRLAGCELVQNAPRVVKHVPLVGVHLRDLYWRSGHVRVGRDPLVYQRREPQREFD